jgi:hypothetical protein
MLGKIRKSSGRVTLVLIGLAGLAGCGDEEKRDLYASREDCLADWGNKPEDCTPSTDARHAGRGFYLGPAFAHQSAGWGWGRSSGSTTSTRSWSSTRSSSSRSSGAPGSTSRGGFGSSGRSSAG